MFFTCLFSSYLLGTAYGKTLRRYHGWVVRGVFAVSVWFPLVYRLFICSLIRSLVRSFLPSFPTFRSFISFILLSLRCFVHQLLSSLSTLLRLPSHYIYLFYFVDKYKLYSNLKSTLKSLFSQCGSLKSRSPKISCFQLNYLILHDKPH